MNIKTDTASLFADELPGFEEAWTGNVKGRLPGWRGDFNMHGNAGKHYLVLSCWTFFSFSFMFVSSFYFIYFTIRWFHNIEGRMHSPSLP